MGVFRDAWFRCFCINECVQLLVRFNRLLCCLVKCMRLLYFLMSIFFTICMWLIFTLVATVLKFFNCLNCFQFFNQVLCCFIFLTQVLWSSVFKCLCCCWFLKSFSLFTILVDCLSHCYVACFLNQVCLACFLLVCSVYLFACFFVPRRLSSTSSTLLHTAE